MTKSMKKNIEEEKVYKLPIKILAVFLPIAAFLTLMIVWGTTVGQNAHLEYAHYESCRLVDASAEKQEDGSYIITAKIKNDSSYQSYIYKSSVYVEYGNRNRLENLMPQFAETDLLRSLNSPIIPSGRTIEYKLQILPPEGVHSVRLSYRGVSYNRYNITDEDPESVITLKLS